MSRFGALRVTAAAAVLALCGLAAVDAPGAAALELSFLYKDSGINFLSFAAFNGPFFAPCTPAGTEASFAGLYDVAFVWLRGTTKLYHGTAYGNWDSSSIRDESFYTLSEDYARFHCLAHSYFPTAMTAGAYKKTGEAFQSAKIARFTASDTDSPAPDFMLLEPLMVEHLLASLSAAYNVFKTEYALESEKTTGTGASNKKVPKNVAALRALAHKWNDFATQIPLKGAIQQRIVPHTSFTTALGGVLARKEGRDTLPTAPKSTDVDVEWVKAELGKVDKWKHLAQSCSLSDMSAAGDTLLYDELVLFGKPASHLDDIEVNDPNLQDHQDDLADLAVSWIDKCSSLQWKDPPYTVDYRAWVPGGANLKVSFDAAGVQAVWKGDLKLDDLRAETDKVIEKVVAMAARHGDSSHKKAATELKSIVLKSSKGLLTGEEVSTLRVHAYRLLQLACTKDAAWSSIIEVPEAGRGRAAQVAKLRLCKRGYLQLNDHVIPISRNGYFKNDKTDMTPGGKKGQVSKCKWSWEHKRCEPQNLCARSYKFGDLTFSQSCVTTRG